MSCCCKGAKGHRDTVRRLTPSDVCSGKVFPVTVSFPSETSTGAGKLTVLLKRSDFISLPEKWFSAEANKLLVQALALSASSGLVIADNKAEWEVTADYVKLVADITTKGGATSYRRISEILTGIWNAHAVWKTYPSPTPEDTATRAKFLTTNGKNEIKTYIELADGSVHSCMVSFSLDFQYMSKNQPINVIGGGGGSASGGIDDGSGGGGGGSVSCLTVTLHTWVMDVNHEGDIVYKPLTISQGFSGWRDFERYWFAAPEAMGFVTVVEFTADEKINNSSRDVPYKVLAHKDHTVRGGWRIEADDDSVPTSFVSLQVSQDCIRSVLDYSSGWGGTVVYYFRRVSDAVQYAVDNKLTTPERDKAWAFTGQSISYEVIGDSPNYAVWKIAGSANDAMNGSRLWGGTTGFKYDLEYAARYEHAWPGYSVNKVGD